jgi:hypothetical protein
VKEWKDEVDLAQRLERDGYLLVPQISEITGLSGPSIMGRLKRTIKPDQEYNQYGLQAVEGEAVYPGRELVVGIGKKTYVHPAFLKGVLDMAKGKGGEFKDLAHNGSITPEAIAEQKAQRGGWSKKAE